MILLRNLELPWTSIRDRRCGMSRSRPADNHARTHVTVTSIHTWQQQQRCCHGYRRRNSRSRHELFLSLVLHSQRAGCRHQLSEAPVPSPLSLSFCPPAELSGRGTAHARPPAAPASSSPWPRQTHTAASRPGGIFHKSVSALRAVTSPGPSYHRGIIQLARRSPDYRCARPRGSGARGAGS